MAQRLLVAHNPDPDSRLPFLLRVPIDGGLAVATCRRRGVADLLARVQVRYPAVAIVFAGSRKHGEEYTFRFLGGRPSGARLGPGRRAD